MPKPIEYHYLVLSGAGACGIIYAGVFRELSQQPNFSFEKLKAVAGTSAGAMAALLVALNYSPDEIDAKLSNINFEELTDNRFGPLAIYDLFEKYGLYSGDELYALIKGFIAEKIPDKDPELVTFGDLVERGFKKLHIVTTMVYLNAETDTPIFTKKVFSTDKHYDTPVAPIIRCSASAPGVFQGMRLVKIAKGAYIPVTSQDAFYTAAKNTINEQELSLMLEERRQRLAKLLRRMEKRATTKKDAEGFLIVDGGMLDNFPIKMFDLTEYMPNWDGEKSVPIINPHVLGIALRTENQILNVTKPKKTPLGEGEAFKFIQGALAAITQQFSQMGTDVKENAKRTIFCRRDVGGLSAFNFAISDEQKELAKAAGKEGVQNYFAQLELAPDRVNEVGITISDSSSSDSESSNDSSKHQKIRSATNSNRAGFFFSINNTNSDLTSSMDSFSDSGDLKVEKKPSPLRLGMKSSPKKTAQEKKSFEEVDAERCLPGWRSLWRRKPQATNDVVFRPIPGKAFKIN